MTNILGNERDRDVLNEYISKLSDHIYGALLQVDVQSIFDQTYLDLMRRMRANLLGLYVQIPLWPTTHEMKIPIELLFRSLLTDSITLLYQATLEESEETFTNELLHLDGKVIKYIEDYIENYELIDDAFTVQEKLAKKIEIYNLVPHLRKEGNILEAKNFKQIRSSSEQALFLATSRGGFNVAWTEHAMFEQIKSHPSTRHLAYLYIYQRLFSQTHHYAPANRTYSAWNFDHVCLNWFIALQGLYRVVEIAVGLLGASDEVKSIIRQEYQELSKYMSD